MRKHTKLISAILALAAAFTCLFSLMLVTAYAEEAMETETDTTTESRISMNMELDPRGSFNLTELGSIDWMAVHSNRDSNGVYYRKDIESPIIKHVAAGGYMYNETKARNFSFAWSDGDSSKPTAEGYVYYAWARDNSYFQYSVPVEAYNQTLTMFVAVYMGENEVQAYFESNPDEVFTVEIKADEKISMPYGKATIDFSGKPGDNLIVTFKRVGFCSTWVAESKAWQCQTQVYALALDHEHIEVVDDAVSPTCTENGLTEGKHCSDCKEVLVAQEVVPATGDHVYAAEKEKVAATCEADGYVIMACGCGETQTTTLSAIGHDYEAVVTAPTCTTAGYTTYTCKNDGSHTYVADEVAALGHTASEAVKEKEVAPDCDTQGSYDSVVYCSVCTVEVSRENIPVDALGHTEVVDAAVSATCTETGLTEGKHCSVCKEVLVAQNTVDALGHTEAVDAAVAPTCTSVGKTEGKHCSVCDEVLVAQKGVSALGHTEAVDAAVTPTCTETGLTEGSHCSVCSEVLVAQNTVDALGHTEVVDKAVAPTCTEAGKSEGKHCSECNEVLVAQEEIPAIGHDWQDATTKAPKTCENCGATEGEKLNFFQGIWLAILAFFKKLFGLK